jgi:hypothetical protein
VSTRRTLLTEVSRVSEPGQYARTQAVFQTVSTVIEIAGALAGGALFTLNPAYAFLSITAVCVASGLTGFVSRTVFSRMVEQT